MAELGIELLTFSTTVHESISPLALAPQLPKYIWNHKRFIVYLNL